MKSKLNFFCLEFYAILLNENTTTNNYAKSIVVFTLAIREKYMNNNCKLEDERLGFL